MKGVMGLAIAVCIACGSHGQAHLQETAERINPVITQLRASAGIVLDSRKRSDVNAVTAACLAGIEISRPLSSIDFKDEFVGNDRKIGINDVMFMFAHDLRTECPDGHHDSDCAEWCVERYSELADAVDRLRGLAAKQNVSIEPLRQ